MGNVACPFCDKQLQERAVKNEPFCVMMKEENVDGVYVCKNCGMVKGRNWQLNLLIMIIIALGLQVNQSTIESIILRMFLWISVVDLT